MIEVRLRMVIIIYTFLTIILNFYNSNVLNYIIVIKIIVWNANNPSINIIYKLSLSIREVTCNHFIKWKLLLLDSLYQPLINL